MPASAIGTQFTVNEEVSNTQELAQVVVLPDGRLLATWMSFDADVDGSGAGISVRIGTVQANGTIVWGAAGEVTVNEEVQFDQLEPEVIVLPDGRLLFTWTSLDPDVDGSSRGIAARIGTPQADGSIVWGAAGEFTVNVETSSLQLEPRVTLLADGRVMFTWQSQDGDVDGSGAAISARIGTVQSDGSIVWATAGEFRVNEEVTNGQFGPQVIVLGDGRVLATWYSADADVDGNGNGLSVRVGTVQTNGSILWGAAGEVTVNEEVENGQGPVQVTTLDDGRLLFTWGSSDADVDGSGAGISGRVGAVQADGSIAWATAGEFTVNATATGDQSDPQITVLTDGRVLFLWTNGDPGIDADISGRVGEIQADGSVIWDPAGEFTVNSQTAGAQRQVQVTELSDGRLLVVWTGANSDGNGAGIAGSVVVFNSAPITHDDAFAIDENAVLSGGNLFADNGSGADDSVDTDALAVTAVNGSSVDVGVQITLASGALLTVNANGTFTYDPNGAFTLGLDASDTDSFTYTVDDGFGGSDTATVTITINSVSETITGTGDADTLSGGAGNDSISGLGGDDTLNGDAGDDTITGGAGLDALNGGDGNDTLNGGADADVLDGGTGADSMSGGAGDDTYYFDSNSDTANELLNEGTDLVISSNNFTGLNSNLENLTLAGSGSSSGFGNTLNNIITGNTGANQLSGGGGVDALYGGDGNDILYAWSGTNFSGNGALVDPTFLAGEIFDGGAGTDTLYLREDWTFDLSGVTLNSIEALWVMSSATVNIDADDLGAGLAANLTVTSNTSDIRINVTRNSAGATSVAGWTLNAFNTGDQIALIGSIGNDTLTGSAHLDILDGNDGDDILNAGAGNDTVTGGAGADTIDGGTGADAMSGGAGDDTYYVDNGSDVVTELDGQGADTVVTGLVYSLAGTFIENLTLVGGDLNGTGSALNNIITGTAGNNVLIGGGGVDQLLGGDGNDTLQISGAIAASDNAVLSGGAGTDTLNFGSPFTIYDLRGSSISSIERLALVTGGEVHFNSSAGLSSTLEVIDGVSQGVLAVHLSAPGTLDVSSWTFTNWSYGIDPDLYGTSGADTIIGASVDDNTYAGDGNDIVNSGAATDEIWGEGGDDTIDGGSGDDFIDGGAGSDSLIGGADADVINGGDGADSIDGGSGIDAMSGGDGDDTFVVDNGSDTVSESSNQGTDTVQSTVNFTIGANIENLTLTGAGAIDGTGNSLNNVITGNTGNNLLVGGGGVDQLLGGDGDDTLQLSGAVTALQVAVLSGGAGTDTLSFGSAFTVYDLRGSSISSIERLAFGFGGEVHFNVGAGLSATLEVIDTSSIGVLALHLTAPGAIDISGWTFTSWSFGIDPDLYGTSGADTITGASVDDNTYAGDGNDTVNSGAGSDEIWGEGGVDVIDGGSGDDFIDGGLGNDSLTGGADADTLNGGDGSDTMIGGDGNDTYVVDNAGDVTSETSALGGTDTVQSSLTRTLGANLENLVLTGAAAISGFGNGLNNAITGNSAANQLNGFDGNDVLNGQGGADSMFGGNGDDAYYVDSTGDLTTETSALGGIDIVYSSVARNLTANIENLTLTGAAAVSGSGNALNNLIIGNTGANTLYGFDGNDRLDGGAGADTLFGAAGDDVYVVDDVGDITVEGLSGAAGGIDTVETYISRNMNANFENMILMGSATIAYGNVLGNVLTGNALANALYGFDGNDTLDGGAGADSMFGANGDDTYIVDNAGDVTSEVSALGGVDTVISSVERNLTANLENLTLSGGASINGAGNGLNNVITGNSGVNTLFGLGGDDTLNGGLGADTLQGGAGADAYVFSSALGGGNIDAIVGFSVADDTIVLSNAVFTGLSAGALAASAFTIGAAAADADDRIIYNSATGQLYFDADGNGGGAAVLFATLSAGLSLTSADFIVGGP